MPIFGLNQGDSSLIANLYTYDGQIISYGGEEARIRYAFNMGSFDDFTTLLPYAVFEHSVLFHFPPEGWIGSGPSAVLPSGRYRVGFVYQNINIGPYDHALQVRAEHLYDWDAWVGEVESNQVEICIQNP